MNSNEENVYHSNKFIKDKKIIVTEVTCDPRGMFSNQQAAQELANGRQVQGSNIVPS